MKKADLLVGVDVGGTFTDVFVFDTINGNFFTTKVPSTIRDQSLGFIEGVAKIVPDFSVILNIVHGSTVGTNALLEKRGAKTGIITTLGFADILEMRRRDRPKTWGLKGDFKPVVERKYRLEVPERGLADGEILEKVCLEKLQDQVEKLLALGRESICLFFVNSYANNKNEKLAAKKIRELWPNSFVSVSTEILPEMREFERLSTTVLNAYLQPVVSSYLDQLKSRLSLKGFDKEILIVQSNGGTMSLDIAKKYPIRTTLSGPAAGVMAGRSIGIASGFTNIITCDMGGTSFDVSLINNGKVSLSPQTSIDFGMVVRTPMIEVTTIGAGGGSIASLDNSGLLKVGPESAGSDPGPVCYGLGNTKPTVTDANLVLGLISCERPIGGKLDSLDIEKSKIAIKEHISDKLKISVEDGAEAILKVANAKMAGAIRLVSIEKGHDPDKFSAMPFGGGGALHTGALIKEVGLRSAIIPRFPGVTSALGCVVADLLYDRVQTVNKLLSNLDSVSISKQLKTVSLELETYITASNTDILRLERFYEFDMLYAGQTHTVVVPIDIDNVSLSKEEIQKSFDKAYLDTYGRLLENIPVKVVNFRVIVIGRRPSFDMSLFSPKDGKTESECILEKREIYANGKTWLINVYDRLALDVGEKIIGPALLEQSDTTIFLNPGLKAVVDQYGNLIINDIIKS
tara:strand:+ start:982 stop:3039 length:2058 start_codon:yes stop_codon:yes gene_type:complete